jgi:hypothetical protein
MGLVLLLLMSLLLLLLLLLSCKPGRHPRYNARLKRTTIWQTIFGFSQLFAEIRSIDSLTLRRAKLFKPVWPKLPKYRSKWSLTI